MQKKGEIELFIENHTTSTVSFTVTTKSVQLNRMMKTGLERVFKLDSSVPMSNMHAFDHNSTIQKYSSVEDIANAYFPIRMDLYHDRKNTLECSKEYEAAILLNKARFIEEVVDGSIGLMKGGKTKLDTIHELQENNFAPLSELETILSQKHKKIEQDLIIEKKEDLDNDEDGTKNMKQYDYLLSMPLSSLTAEKVEYLRTQANAANNDLKDLKEATPESLWHTDLNKLESYLKKHQ